MLLLAGASLHCSNTPDPPVSCYRRDGSTCKFGTPDGNSDVVASSGRDAAVQSDVNGGDGITSDVRSSALDLGAGGNGGFAPSSLGAGGSTVFVDSGADTADSGSTTSDANNRTDTQIDVPMAIPDSGPDTSDAVATTDTPPDSAPDAFHDTSPDFPVADTRDADIDSRDAVMIVDVASEGPEVGTDTSVPAVDATEVAQEAGVSDAADASADTPSDATTSPGSDATDAPGADRADSATVAHTCPGSVFAKKFSVGQLTGMTSDGTGNLYVTGNLYGTNVDFGGTSVSSLGNSDIVLAKLDPTTGTPSWVQTFHGVAASESTATLDQRAAGVAFSQSGKIGVIGTMNGSLVVNATTELDSNTSVQFVMGTDGSGAGVWVAKVDLKGTGALTAIAGNSARDEFVVCGNAMGAVSDLNTNGTAGGDGKSDIFIAKLNATTGAPVWAHQFGSAGTQTCNALALADDGSIYATGTFNGTLDLGNGIAFPTVYTSPTAAIWVVKFNADGTALSKNSFGPEPGTGSVETPRAIALDGSGGLAIAGGMQDTMSIGKDLTSAGGQDGFVAKLDGTLSPVWANRWGDDQDQEARSVAFNSAGDVIVAGYLFGAAPELGSSGLTSAGDSDAFWAKFDGANGNNVCAQAFGDVDYTQIADLLTVSPATAGAQKDMVNIAGHGNGATGASFPVGTNVTLALPAKWTAFTVQFTP
jgi:hypothetical protein